MITDQTPAQPVSLDDDFDRALGHLIGAGTADTAMLSRAVLSRLADPPGTEPAPLASVLAGVLAGVLAAPAPLAAGIGTGLLLLGAAGYALAPLIGGDEALALWTMQDLFGLGGF